MKPKIIILSRKGINAEFIYNRLKDSFTIQKVLFEEKEKRKVFIKRRIKKVGILRFLGQHLFFQFVYFRLKRKSQSRIEAIVKEFGLDKSEIPEAQKVYVPSVNHRDTIQRLLMEKPDIVIVYSTRIISKAVLDSVKARFVNIHFGINPKYRGNGGAYWALVNRDPENCGATIHFIDGGVDTGSILYQDKIKITPLDNYVTCMYLQFAKGLDLLQKAIEDIVNNEVKVIARNEAPKTWYEPTIWEYLYYRTVKKVK